MASSSQVASTTVPLKKHDVFVSFRGEDTRAGFTSHLYDALCRSSVHTYIDNRIEKGDEVWAELVKAIKESTLFLVVLSEDYASSTWCLNELIEIMECKKNGQDVIPVFYHVEPSHVRKQTGSYHTALAKHKKQGKDKIQKWKNVPSEVANLSGFHSTTYRTESDLIEDIIKEVLGKLNQKYTNEIGCHFIPDENYSHIESLIKIDSREVQIIGLWGMGGIGKTTLAAAVFQKASFQYEGSCFLENVTEETKMHGISYIYNKLLSTLLGEDLGIVTPKVISSMVLKRLKHVKAFIVLDDIHTSKLLQNLIGVGHGWLGAGSTVIVTTRDKHVLISGGVDIDKIHQVKEMNSQNSLQLFSLNAFNKVLPNEGYEELSKRAIDYAKGNPLALKVLGSILCYKREVEWDSALAKLKEIPNAEIQKVLRLSYDELDEKEKNIFLDIACFFKGYERDRVTKILNDCGFFADIGIRNLLDRALIKVDLENCIQMHDLIQEMGKQIVREESPKNPGQCTRLWDHKEVCDVLTNIRGTEAVEAIFLDLTQITHINLSPNTFKRMSNIRLLAFRDHKGIESLRLPRGLDSLPNSLRYFGWDGYPLKSLPSTFCPDMLVELSLQDSNMEKLWDGVQNLPNLEKLDLSGSKRLTECPNLSGAPNLKHVVFLYCERLALIDSSKFSPKLEVLNVFGCTSLKSLSITCSPSLQELRVQACINLQELSVALMPNIASMNHLTLGLGLWALNELPSSILQMRNLKQFCFPINDSLVDLPENFARTIWLFGPWENEIATQSSVTTLRKVLPSPAFLSLRFLSIIFCNSLHEIPENISLLSSLEILILHDCAIRSLPETIKNLPRLKHLDVGQCNALRYIPALPQSIQLFCVWKCESLEIVLSSTSEPNEKSKCGFLFLNCIKLDPPSYDNILKDAVVRMERGARLNCAISENEDCAFLDHDDSFFSTLYEIHTLSSGIWYFLPAMIDEVRHRFHYHSTQALVTVELPTNLLGFVYYLVLSQGHIPSDGGFGCECHLETSSGERINITSFVVVGVALFCNIDDTSSDMMSDHVLIWYDRQCCRQIMEAVEERKVVNDVSTGYNPKLTFRFFVDETLQDKVAIKECGFRWIYATEDQIVVEEGGRCKSERSREIHELENSEVQYRADGFESDKQKETVTQTKKLKQRVLEFFGLPLIVIILLLLRLVKCPLLSFGNRHVHMLILVAIITCILVSSSGTFNLF